MFKPISREEYHKLKGIGKYGKDNCPFCDIEKQEGSIIWKGKKWFIIYTLASYSGDCRHIMAIPHQHIRYSYELTNEHFQELKDIHNFVKEFFKDEEYFSFTRESMGNRSVEHLHIHFLVGKLQGKFLRKMLQMQGYPITQELKID